MCNRLLVYMLFFCASSLAQETYKQPPKPILDVLHAPTLPAESLSPGLDFMLLRQARDYPPIADVSQPMLRLAGLRINPKTNGPHGETYSVSLKLKKIADGIESSVTLPPSPRLRSIEWSRDGKH